MNKIIQCPSCNTKFALNSNQLAGIESPKFHCSRCNTIFSVDSESEETSQNVEKNESLSAEENTYFETDAAEEQEESLFEDKLTEEDLEDPIFEEDDNSSEENYFAQDISNKTTEVATHEAVEESLNDSSEYEDEFEEPEIEVDFNSFSGRVSDTSPIKSAIESDDRDLVETELEEDEWEIGNQSSPIEETISHASQLPLNYEENQPEDSESFEEDLAIDWPTDDGTKSFVVDLAEKPKDNLIAKNRIDNPSDFSRSADSFTKVESLSKNDSKTGEYERPEVKSLLASLIGDDIDEAKHKSNNSLPSNSPVSTNEVALITDSEDAFETRKIRELDEVKPNHEESTQVSSQNRSFKETTVLKRDQISFDSFNEEDEDEDDSFNFNSLKPSLTKKASPIEELTSKFKGLAVADTFTGSSGTFKTYLYAWSLPIATLLILAWFSNSIASQTDAANPNFSKTVIETLGLNKAPSDILPPNDVVVSKLNGTILDLNSGERIVLTSGNILNMSTQSYRNIKLESRIFDKNQISLTRKITAVPNKLSKEFIKSKSFDVLDSQQNSPLNGDNNEILQKTITEFLMAIDITGLEKDLYPKFFGVRVYSVGK